MNPEKSRRSKFLFEVGDRPDSTASAKGLPIAILTSVMPEPLEFWWLAPEVVFRGTSISVAL